MKRYAFSLILALVALSFSHPTAFHSYASFKGKKQGQLKAESLKGGREKDGWFEIFSFSVGTANTGTDNKSGKGGGQGKVAPIVITKEKDEASPKLLNAQVNSETFETIVIQTIDRPQTGAGEKVVETVTLTNAQIIEYKTNSGLETISFTYDQIIRKK